MKIAILRFIILLIGLFLLTNVAWMWRVTATNPTVGFTIQAVISVCLILYALLFRKIPKILHIAIGILCLIPVVFALFLGFYGNVSNTDHTEDVVIVLGAGVHGERVSAPLARRLDTAIAYWNENPNAIIIVTGGLGNRASITEAEAMSRYLIARGIPPDRILLEDRSTTTYENLVFANEILSARFPDGFRSVLITNDFHIYRAVGTARQAGLDPNRLGAPTDWVTQPVNYFREMLAVLNFWLFQSLY